MFIELLARDVAEGFDKFLQPELVLPRRIGDSLEGIMADQDDLVANTAVHEKPALGTRRDHES